MPAAIRPDGTIDGFHSGDLRTQTDHSTLTPSILPGLIPSSATADAATTRLTLPDGRLRTMQWFSGLPENTQGSCWSVNCPYPDQLLDESQSRYSHRRLHGMTFHRPVLHATCYERIVITTPRPPSSDAVATDTRLDETNRTTGINGINGSRVEDQDDDSGSEEVLHAMSGSAMSNVGRGESGSQGA